MIAAGALTYAVNNTRVPQPSELSTAQTTIFYYDDGVTEIGRLGEANRESIDIAQIPLETQQAVLAAEDRQFYQHGGFSVRGISRAILNNLSRSSTQGGSTITQQYAKNAYLTDERRIQRKLRELVLSIKLETVTSKDKILEDYLNTIFFGRGAYGIETAAKQYFDKDVSKLTVEESAVLAAIIQAPNGLSPEENLEGLTTRWNYVLDGMVAQGWLDAAARSTMEFPKIVTYSPPNVFGGPQGHLLEQARKAVYKLGISEDALNRAGYRVVTTFNKQAQDAAIAAVNEKGPKTGTDGLRIGLASIRPGTGEVVALYGGADYLKDQLNNATQAIGQAGSTFKPFTLAAALENDISLSSTFSGKNKTKVDKYVVVNYGDRSFGTKITLLKATENSVNSAYVECAKEVGLQLVLDSAIRAGVPADASGMEPNLAFTLGTASPHVVDIADGYATFAARGLQVEPSYIKQVLNRSGEVLIENKPKPTQAFSTDIADTVTYALQRVVTNGTGVAAKELGRPAAGKTGTTNDNKSALFAGYTQELATVVMFTKDGPDGAPVTLSGTGDMATVTGGSFPARIWTAYMKGALEGTPVSKFPPLPAGQPNGAKPTDSPSPEPIISPSIEPSPSPTDPAPSDGPTPSMVPDISSEAFLRLAVRVGDQNEYGTFAAAQNYALQFGFAVGYVPLDSSVNVTRTLYIVANSQDRVAGQIANMGDTITVVVSNVAGQ